MKKVITIVPIVFLMMTLFVSCGGLDGTYIAKNDAAKKGMYQKFIFKGGKVRVIMGTMGIEMPGGYEYGFKRDGDKISIELGVPGTAMSLGGIELHYNEKADEISLLLGGDVGTAMNEYAPVWGKEGSFDPNNPYPDKKESVVPLEKSNNNDSLPKKKGLLDIVKDLFSSKPKDSSTEPCDEKDFDYSIYNLNTFNSELANTCALYSALAYEDARITTQSDALQSIQANVEPNPVQTPTPDNSNPQKTKYYGLLSDYKTLKANNNIVYFTGKRSDSYIDNNDINKPLILIAQLQYDGYTGITSCNYHDNEEDNISYTLAYKETNNNETQVAVILRGTDYVEWKGDMNIWKDKNTLSERHFSFDTANVKLQNAIKDYVTTNQLKNINFLITGHSRGAAVANLLAVDMNEKKFKICGTKGVVAYTFATPNNSTRYTGYYNIFTFNFDDDFVTQVPLTNPGWGYGKSGIHRIARAEGLYVINDTFKKNIDDYINLSWGRKKPDFNYDATQIALKEFYRLAPTVYDYYNTEHFIGLGHNPESITLCDFMKNYIAQACIDNDNNTIGSAAIGTLVATASNDFQKVASFFVVGNELQNYISDTHQAFTYYYALKANGFLTK